MKKQNKYSKALTQNSGFTLIELLVVISIIGLLASVVLVTVSNARESAKRATAVENIKQLQIALEIYATDMGFYPPDVSRGWDPGIAQALPYDTTGSGNDCATNLASCICNNYLTCTGSSPDNIPANWINIVQTNWCGPYTIKWPIFTPWGGVYDYNYWPVTTDRNGCMVPPGIYLGIESGSGFTLDPGTEQTLYNEGLDNDGCPNNGEVQMLLVKL
ncbi:MAG: prepilin-type N-terminal cleavage/methylation domain-containing protein [Candidatus Doudnabacteria bacterium]|nr:prepilin-type N-terminal cleavage/methylation domain-containing protein [Candidatus Doudnabacteria bacterium]